MIYRFGGFELDTELFELRRGREPIAVEPQVFDLLLCLAANADRIVTKQELFDTVWEGRFVSESTLTSRLKAARRAVGDSGREQRLIRTTRGRGYRLVAPVERVDQSPSGPIERPRRSSSWPTPEGAPRAGRLPDLPPAQLPAPQCGRQSELARLKKHFAEARAGTRQIVFVTGEAGLGKTTLVDNFIHEVRESGNGAVRLAIGRCVEHQGPSEAYLPFLEAISRLCRARDGDGVVDVLSSDAPSWLLQMPSVAADLDIDQHKSRLHGAGPDRMLREMVGALEHLSQEVPLLLVLEDLHWGDVSSVDLLARLPTRSESARLMVVGTLRLSEAERAGHPIASAVRELTLRRGCARLSLGLLAADAVDELIRVQLVGAVVPQALAEMLWERTAGHPLFLVSILKAWRDAELIERQGSSWRPTRPLAELEAGIPETLTTLIEQRLGGLGQQARQMLEAASVAGREFAAATVAAAVGWSDDAVEAQCEALVKRDSFIQEVGLESWPDGTFTTKFAFEHDLYQQVLYGLLSEGRRIRLHRKVGARIEAGAGSRAAERASELAMHYDRGRDRGRAATFSSYAAERSLQRFAYREAMGHIGRGLELVEALPSPRGERLEVKLRVAFGLCATALEGYAAPAIEDAYRRARGLAEALGDAEQLVSIQIGLCRHYVANAEFRAGIEMARELVSLPFGRGTGTAIVAGHVTIAAASLYLGELDACLDHAGQAVQIIRGAPSNDRSNRRDAFEGLILARAHWAWARWMKGWPNEALAALETLIARAREAGHPFHTAFAYHHYLWLLVFEDRTADVESYAETLLTLCEQNGYSQWIGAARCLLGWVRARHGDAAAGLSLVREGVADWAATKSRIGVVNNWLLLAQTLGIADQPGEALETLDKAEALIGETGERWFAPALALSRADLLLALGRAQQAESWLDEALDRSQAIGARMFELRLLQRRSASLSAERRVAEIGKAADDLIAALDGAEEGPLEQARALKAG